MHRPGFGLHRVATVATVAAGCVLALAVAQGTAAADPSATEPAAAPTPGPTTAPPGTAAPSPTVTPTASPTGGQPASPAPAAPAPAAPPRVVAATTPPPPTVAGYPRFYRPANKRGDADGDVYHIRHIRELQYRLRWARVYTGPVTGNFGPLTEAGVKAYQTKRHLPVTGRADLTTWQSLIGYTTTAQDRVPAVCKRSGWHACYDRTLHRLYLYGSGRLWNVWLVRGGSSDAQTDPGTFSVYARYAQKNSSIYGTKMYYFQKFHGAEGLHGSITMIDPYVGHSHGCVNMYIPDAKVLWDIASTKPLVVTVFGTWS